MSQCRNEPCWVAQAQWQLAWHGGRTTTKSCQEAAHQTVFDCAQVFQACACACARGCGSERRTGKITVRMLLHACMPTGSARRSVLLLFFCSAHKGLQGARGARGACAPRPACSPWKACPGCAGRPAGAQTWSTGRLASRRPPPQVLGALCRASFPGTGCATHLRMHDCMTNLPSCHRAGWPAAPCAVPCEAGAPLPPALPASITDGIRLRGACAARGARGSMVDRHRCVDEEVRWQAVRPGVAFAQRLRRLVHRFAAVVAHLRKEHTRSGSWSWPSRLRILPRLWLITQGACNHSGIAIKPA